MSGAAFAYSSVPLRKVKEVQFGILSPEEIVSLLCFYLVATRVGSLLGSFPHTESVLGMQDRVPRSVGGGYWQGQGGGTDGSPIGDSRSQLQVSNMW